jgi:hypothetical protein
MRNERNEKQKPNKTGAGRAEDRTATLCEWPVGSLQTVGVQGVYSTGVSHFGGNFFQVPEGEKFGSGTGTEINQSFYTTLCF